MARTQTQPETFDVDSDDAVRDRLRRNRERQGLPVEAPQVLVDAVSALL